MRYLVRICLLWACDVGEEGITPSGGARACVVETGECEDVTYVWTRRSLSSARADSERGVGGGRAVKSPRRIMYKATRPQSRLPCRQLEFRGYLPKLGQVSASCAAAWDGFRDRGALAAPVLHQAIRPRARPAALQLPARIVLPGERRCHAQRRAQICVRLSASGRHAGARSPARALSRAPKLRPTRGRP